MTKSKKIKGYSDQKESYSDEKYKSTKSTKKKK